MATTSTGSAWCSWTKPLPKPTRTTRDEPWELFQALDLQLIVINPWDAKSRIVENYVDSYHLANTNLSTHCSSLTRATRERYLEVRKAWEAKNAQKVDAEPN